MHSPPLACFFYFYFFDWAQLTRRLQPDTMRVVKVMWGEVEDIETTIWCWWWIKKGKRAYKWEEQEKNHRFDMETALHSTFCALCLFLLQLVWALFFPYKSKWCENFLDMPTNKQHQSRAPPSPVRCFNFSCCTSLVICVELRFESSGNNKKLIKLYDEMMEISPVHFSHKRWRFSSSKERDLWTKKCLLLNGEAQQEHRWEQKKPQNLTRHMLLQSHNHHRSLLGLQLHNKREVVMIQVIFLSFSFVVSYFWWLFIAPFTHCVVVYMTIMMTFNRIHYRTQRNE